jgi:hypothetical protein
MSANTGITLNCLPYASNCSRESQVSLTRKVSFRTEADVILKALRKRLNPSLSKQSVGLVVLLGC